MAQELYELPEGWEWSTLEEQTVLTRNIKPTSTPKQEFTYIDISSIDRNINQITDPKIIFGSEAPSRAKKEVIENDILFATTRPSLKNVAMFSGGVESPVASTGLCILRAAASIEPSFLFRFLTTEFLQQQISPFISGAQYPAITDKNLKLTPIPLPPLNEQKCIVAKLDALFTRIDTAITHLQQTLELSKALFASALSNKFELRNKNWRPVKMADVCSITSKLLDPRELEYIDMLHVGGANIESITGNLIGLKTAREERLISGKFIFDNKVVLYSKIRPYLMKVARPNIHGLCSADIYPLTSKSGELDRGFLFYLLLSEDFTAYAIQGSSRAGMPKVNRKHLFNYEFFIPSLEEQSKITDSLDDLSEHTRNLETTTQEKINDLIALKASLLDAAFKGQL